MGARGPASGVRSIGARAKQQAGAQASARAATPDTLDAALARGGTARPDPSASEPAQVGLPGEAEDTPEHNPGELTRADAEPAPEGDLEESS
jgi:hypothetical protein